MKRFLVLLLILCVGVVVGRRGNGVTSTAEAGGGHGRGAGVAGNGDVNGSGDIDISDASYLLNWLFLGGPEPEPCASGGGEPPGLPDTGQTTCYDQNGNVIDCTSATCAGQDGLYATGCPPGGRFADNGDGTVTDTCTGLVWQKRTADVNRDGRSTSQDRLQWCNALAFCENLSFAGRDDWRLPNVRELQSIIAYGGDPAIDPVFEAVAGAFPTAYWSSTSIALGSLFPWWVDFTYGVTDAGDVDGSGLAYIRAVRSAL